MSWVDHPSYFGPDRRKRAVGFRLWERRRVSYLSEPPTMAAGLRRLRLHLIDATGDEALAKYAAEVHIIALLARRRGRPDIAAVLDELHLNLKHDDDANVDHRITIEYALAACDELLVQHAMDHAPRASNGAFGRRSSSPPAV